jgi:hypothetical protein
MGEQILGAADVVSALVFLDLLTIANCVYRLAPGIMVMQFCTVFFPIYETWTSQAQLRDSLDINQPSERMWSSAGHSNVSNLHRGSTATTMASTSFTENEKHSIPTARPSLSTNSSSKKRRKEMCSMAAFEKALTINPTPLLQFATTKDFTSENIIFLLWVRQWRLGWDQAGQDKHGWISHQAKRQLFRSAVEIYVTIVHMKTSAFPININSRNRSRLEVLFRKAVLTLENTKNKTYEADIFASPIEESKDFLPFPTKHLGDVGQSPNFTSSSKTLVIGCVPEPRSQKSQQDEISFEMQPGNPKSTISIPSEFDALVFDDAEMEVRDMVITNTWPRFVDSVNLHEDMKMGSQGV